MPHLEMVKDLVEKFDRNRDAYLSGKFNVTQVRVQFIATFFTALGWDVNNSQGLAEWSMGQPRRRIIHSGQEAH